MKQAAGLIAGRGAFFISPEGKLINVSNTYHIQVITDNPEMFGLSLEHIRKIYSKYNERMNFEGQARAEIIMDVIEKGWAHIRKEIKSSWIETDFKTLSLIVFRLTT